MGIFEQGVEGELWLMDYLKSKEMVVIQSDCIGIKDNRCFLFEFKHQDRFTAPPYDGHGLPPYQVKKLIRFEELTGVPTYLMVKDKETGEVFMQTFKKLEEGEHFDTKGKRVRRIYPLKNFVKVK